MSDYDFGSSDDSHAPDRDQMRHDRHDAAETKKKMPKWLSVLLAVVAGLSVLGIFVGEKVPDCDSSDARGMVADIFTQIPANVEKLTLTDLTEITETSYDEDAKTRTCRATLTDSAGVAHPVAWTARQNGDSIYYTLEVKG